MSTSDTKNEQHRRERRAKLKTDMTVGKGLGEGNVYPLWSMRNKTVYELDIILTLALKKNDIMWDTKNWAKDNAYLRVLKKQVHEKRV
jgi:hypothetical protein